MTPAVPDARRPLYEELAERIQRVAAEAGLVPGDKLPTERAMAQSLGVSRSSIRQALTLLRSLGFVESRQGDGVYLQRLPQADVGMTPLVDPDQTLPRIMEVREAVETHLARLAARRRSQRDLDELSAAVDDMAAAVAHNEDPSPADARFHSAVARAADNPMFEALMEQLAAPIARTRQASLSRPGRPPRSLEGHRRILEAIRARDEEGASAAMREHLSLVADVAHRQRASVGAGAPTQK